MKRDRAGLSNTRIYQKNKRYYLFARDPVEHPVTGKVAKWHPLCDVSEGMDRAKVLANRIVPVRAIRDGMGDLGTHMEAYKLWALTKRDKTRPTDPTRVPMHEAGSRELARQCNILAEAFEDYDVEDVEPVDIARFCDQWEGRRMSQIYRLRLSGFFAWCCRKGLRTDNPATLIKLEKPDRRMRYVTDAEYHAIRHALATDLRGKPSANGPVLQAFLDLMYLTMQRPTEIRLMRWSQVDRERGVITFTPTKTERSTGATVLVRITPAIEEALQLASSGSGVSSVFVIKTRRGQPYTTFGLSSIWQRACVRAKVKKATSRDIRAKALTDAKKAGYSMQELQIGAGHANASTTQIYMKQGVTSESAVELGLPKSATFRSFGKV